MPKVTGVKCSFTKACVNSGPRLRLPGSSDHYCMTHMKAVVSLPSLNASIDFETPARLDVGDGHTREAWATSQGIIAK